MNYTIKNPFKIINCFYPRYDNFTGVAEDEFGNIAYYKNGTYHRVGGPAVIQKNGGIIYCQNGKWHREDGPAVIDKDGVKRYWLNNILLDVKSDQELKDYLILRMFE